MNISPNWQPVIAELAGQLQQRQIHPSRAVVLVPYAQLMEPARLAWQQAQQGVFTPRFETTMNWARNMGGFVPTGDDLSFDMALDILVAASLLNRAGLLKAADESLQDHLAQKLVEAAYQLAGVAAALCPSGRAAWARQVGAALADGLTAPALMWEAALAQVALAWVANSSYASDVLFSDEVVSQVDALFVVQGFQLDALARALMSRFESFSLHFADQQQGLIYTHVCQDSQDEAERAAACVLAHLNAGRNPVALPAQDRMQTRRVAALLGQAGVSLRDETGWMLSTTRAAANVMTLLRASVFKPSSDAVLDWLKNTPADLKKLEVSLRKLQVNDWRSFLAIKSVASELPPEIQTFEQIRQSLQSPRVLAQWLKDLKQALAASGVLSGLQQDEAGQQVINALHLDEENDWAHERMSQSAFTRWCSTALEAASFLPSTVQDAQVVILPLPQLLGRSFAALVLSGCDDAHLSASPEPAGSWTAAQRQLLGLPSRPELAQVQLAVWQHALQVPLCDLLWRTSEQGQAVQVSGLVQQLVASIGIDPRIPRIVQPLPIAAPQPNGKTLGLAQLSASAYDDLRTCPYRFFAQRLLKLGEQQELDQALSKRDWGTWLHEVLKNFHEQRGCDDLAGIEAAAEQATKKLIGTGQDASAQFLPFAASWPKVRDGYLAWLKEHEALGLRFSRAEVPLQAGIAGQAQITLHGYLDRIDTQHSPEGPLPFVIDYKTEAAATTAARTKEPFEDTQLAFYAALLNEETVSAAYVNVGESGTTKTYEQVEVLQAREALLAGIESDFSRIAAGHPLPALGQGKACDFCKVRGLCRRDFWSEM